MLSTEQVQRIQGHRIPVTTGCHEGLALTSCFKQNPLVSVDVSSDTPTDEELELLKKYQSFVGKLYIPIVMERPFPGSTGHNTTIFKKTGTRWQYRRITWTMGPTWIPEPATTLNDAIEREVGEPRQRQWQEHRDS